MRREKESGHEDARHAEDAELQTDLDTEDELVVQIYDHTVWDGRRCFHYIE